jgi:hypothetical protein
VLAMPLKNVDLSVKLPPGLQLAATPAGHLDCRMQLMSFQMDWPATSKQLLVVGALSVLWAQARWRLGQVERCTGSGRIVSAMGPSQVAVGPGAAVYR